MLLALNGMKKVERAAFSATYKTVWCAGPAIEHVTSIQPLADIIKTLVDEFDLSRRVSGDLKIAR